jgi:hypothetical protein
MFTLGHLFFQENVFVFLDNDDDSLHCMILPSCKETQRPWLLCPAASPSINKSSGMCALYIKGVRWLSALLEFIHFVAAQLFFLFCRVLANVRPKKRENLSKVSTSCELGGDDSTCRCRTNNIQ